MIPLYTSPFTILEILVLLIMQLYIIYNLWFFLGKFNYRIKCKTNSFASKRKKDINWSYSRGDLKTRTNIMKGVQNTSIEKRKEYINLGYGDRLWELW